MKRGHKTAIFNWRKEDGWSDVPLVLRRLSPERGEREFNEDMVGWFCTVYAEDDDHFEAWMLEHMKGEYDITRRFNSGNPMSTVWIKEDEDAMFFRLVWR